MTISIIVAKSLNNVIGINNQLPWHLSSDLKYFKKNTLYKTIVMGRNTFESIGKPLPDRHNIVLTKNPNFMASGCQIVSDPKMLINRFASTDEELMIIGGAKVYNTFLPYAAKLYVTEVQCKLPGDAFFPKIQTERWREIFREAHHKDDKNDHDFCFVMMEKLKS